MEKIFCEIDSENFCVHLAKEENSLKVSGKVYPIVHYTTLSNEVSDLLPIIYSYLSAPNSTPIKNIDGAICLFEFSFCWRGVWEGRIYFKEDEYWSEDLSIISRLWDSIERKIKPIIKK